MRKTVFIFLLILGLSLELLAQPTNGLVDAFSKPPATGEPFSPDKLISYPGDSAALIQKLQKKVLPLLNNGDYGKLEELAAGFRVSKRQLPSGSWELMCFYEALTDMPKLASPEAWLKRRDQLQSWADKMKTSITARVALADHCIGYAWHARGNGYADTVTNDGWRLMGDRLVEAEKVLRQAARLEAKCPHYYFVWQKLALGQSWPREEYVKVIKDGLALEPTYMSIYFSYIHFLQPRWHGKSPDEWYAMVKEQADSLGGEEGDLFYARCSVRVFQNRYYDTFLKDSPVDWPRLKRGLEICQKRYPDSIWAKTRLCYFCGQKGERQQMKELFLEIGHTVDTSQWSTERFLKDRAWAFRH
jgi:hypothetical protein